jgi:UDP-N-acetylglucosamine 2-epimerase (non-hydrolysing)
VQEETTYLGIPCLTLRENTERPITLSGTNRLIQPGGLLAAVREVVAGQWPRGKKPHHWDGRTADRCVSSLKAWLDTGAVRSAAA